MNAYRYRLDNSRPTRLFICPNCEWREFKCYVDSELGEYLPEHVGRCNREHHCGYHYTPRHFFSETGQSYPESSQRRRKGTARTAESTATEPQLVSVIPFDLFRDSLENTEARQGNNLIRYLFRRFHASITGDAVRRYFIGSSTHVNGATVFWQIDREGNVRAGKVMLYDPITGRRNKDRKPTWIHTLVPLPGYRLGQCFFGEHLLKSEPENKPVAVVESEKTAIIGSIYLPEYIWLASGGLRNLSPDRCSVLTGHEVILYPDLGCFETWSEIADKIRANVDCRIAVSDLLERNANDTEREYGLDLADYLIRSCPNYGWALAEEGYPMFWDN